MAALWALLVAAPAAALYESPAVPASAPVEAAKIHAVILDPGHGGDDLGAVVKGRREKDIALSISRKVKAKLESLGSPVKLTRDSDVFIPLDQRVTDGEGWDGRVFVSLHLNQARSKKARGISVYAFGKDRHHIKRHKRHHKVPPLPAPPQDEARASNDLAQAVVSSLRAQGFEANQAKAGFYVLKNPALPSVLIELGYLSNPKEAANLSDPEYQDRLAEAVAVSLQSYFATSGPDEAAPVLASKGR